MKNDYKNLLQCYSTLNAEAQQEAESELLIPIAHQLNNPCSEEASSENHWMGKILVIDDQADMWTPVWDFIFRGAVDVVGTGEEGLEKIQKSSEDYHCVLLDIDLGEGRENGLCILQRIKNIRFELPVVIMSNFDHATLTKKSLSYGADNYFVKELDDSNRNSVEYYTSLIDMIEALPGIEAKQRTLWKEFVKLEQQVQALDEEFKTQIGSFTKKAFYYLTLDPQHFLPASLLIPEWHPADQQAGVLCTSAELNASFAADEIFKVSLCLTNDSLRQKADPWGRIEGARVILYPPNEKQNITFRDRLDRSCLEYNGKSVFALGRAQSARHAAVPLGYKYLDYAARCIDDVIFLIQAVFEKWPSCASSSPPVESLFSPEEIDKTCNLDLSIFGGGPKNQETHASVSETGAKQFATGLQGLLDAKEITVADIQADSSKVVLLIDDEGEKSPWITPLRGYFTLKGCRLIVSERYDSSKIQLSEFLLVLLDLSFPGNPFGGLDSLRAMKQANMSIPVIMLTADSSGRSSRRCLFSGADDYFIKSPAMDPRDHVRSFDRTVSYYLENWNNSHVRLFWRAIAQFRDNLESSINQVTDEEIAVYRETLKKDYQKKFYNNHEKDAPLLYLKESYFYYLLNLGTSNVERYRFNRLLVTRHSPLHEAIFSLAKFVELVAVFQYIIDRRSQCSVDKLRKFIHKKIESINQPDDIKGCFLKIWSNRINIKTAASPLSEEEPNDLIFQTAQFLCRFKFNRINIGDRVVGTVQEYGSGGIFIRLFSGRNGFLYIGKIGGHLGRFVKPEELPNLFQKNSSIEVRIADINGLHGEDMYQCSLQ
ncbi:MAG: response regulator [Bacteroidia bacterium]|nr:response regulator [Bacteroidia bacterium]